MFRIKVKVIRMRSLNTLSDQRKRACQTSHLTRDRAGYCGILYMYQYAIIEKAENLSLGTDIKVGSVLNNLSISGKNEAPMVDSAEIKELTEQERKEQIEYHLSELKKLRATPRSDWHAGFEALLRIETHKYADRVHISTEEEIGEVPPRTDFVILVEDEQVEWEKEIFRIFRKINILEYKNPHDALNRRVIRKVCGYANLYIGAAEHENERPENQVTLSIFRAVKNPELFDEMENDGTLVRDETPGIYHVNGYTNLPFQIVITGELKGEEYAAYRALTDKADAADVMQIIEDVGQEMDDAVREHYRVVLRLVAVRNPQFIEAIKRGDIMSYEEMDNILMEIVKDKVDERVAAKEQQTLVSSIRNLMSNLGFSVTQAMDALSIPQSQRSTYAGLVDKLMQ